MKKVGFSAVEHAPRSEEDKNEGRGENNLEEHLRERVVAVQTRLINGAGRVLAVVKIIAVCVGNDGQTRHRRRRQNTG